MLCQSCPSKSVCNSACPELELHLKEEIEITQREKTIGTPIYSPAIRWPSAVALTRGEREIVTLLGKGLSRDDVCETLDITRHNLRMHLTRLKKKHAEM